MLDKLVKRSGRVRSLLQLPDNETLVDLSGPEWGRGLHVLRGLTFDRVALQGSVTANLVECTLNDSRLEVATDGHFLGGGNVWSRCEFVNCDLRAVISPQNRFLGCEFRSVKIGPYSACQTLFQGCRFQGVEFEAFRAVPQRNFKLRLPEVAKSGGSVLFEQCAFEGTSFSRSAFRDVCFNDCTYDRVVARDCSFVGIAGRDDWWRAYPSVDVFVLFLDAVIAELERALGRDSTAYRVFSAYVLKYKRGEVASRDYSADLDQADMLDDEMDVVDDVFNRLEAQYIING